MKVIELTKGHVAIVDDEDFEYLAQWRWHLTKAGYAIRNSQMVNRVRGKMVYMHREIMRPPIGMEVDHENGNKLDNRRINLRLATRPENNWNRGCNKNSKTRVKGVCWCKQMRRFVARIGLNGKTKKIGYFDTLDEASRAYNTEALRIAGKFAKLNA